MFTPKNFDNKRLDDRADFNNRMLLGIVLFLIIVVPIVASVFIATLWTYVAMYGPEYIGYWKTFVTKPEYLVMTYKGLVEYWWAYSNQLEMALSMKIVGPPIAAVVFILITLFLLRAPLMDFRPFKHQESVHGDAHWASPAEIKAAGLLSKTGVLMGAYKKGKYYCADGFQHILLFAPTGSGKGVGFAIPNLLFWDQTACVHDIKLENYELASGWRAKEGQEVYVWNPADPNGITHCYNPLDWISTKPGQQVDDVQKIGNLILPEQEFWQNEARSLLVGVILYLCAVPEKATSFGEVVRTMRSDDVTYNLAVVLDTIGKKIHPVAYMNIAAFLQKADKERSGVVSTMNSGLELWANPLIDTATASSDFNVQHWKKKKMTVYCGVTPDNLQRLQPLLQVFYQQCTDMLTRHMPQPDEPIGVLFLLDEFPTLGKMPQFEAGIAYFRGYRVRLFLIVQDTQQLKGIYEEAGMNSFLSNATYRITFAANNVETANLISQMVGNKTVRQESHNMPKFLDLNPAARTKHVSETQRALLLPQEVIQLPRDEQIILIESQPPIKCKKIAYYADPFFTKRLLEQTPVPEQEPYDPRKGDKVEDEKPETKSDEEAKAKDPKQGKDGPPPAGGSAQKAPAGGPPSDGSGGGKKKNPFDLPPLPPKDGAKKKEKASSSPFDAAPAKPKKGAADKPNPFDAPSDKKDAKKKDEASGKDATKPAAANPFDAPTATKGKQAPASNSDKNATKNPFEAPPKTKSSTSNPFEVSGNLQSSKATPGNATPEKFGPPIPEPSKPDSNNPFAKPTAAAKPESPQPQQPSATPSQSGTAEQPKSAADSNNPFAKPTAAAKPESPQPQQPSATPSQSGTAEQPKAAADSNNPFAKPTAVAKSEAPKPQQAEAPAASTPSAPTEQPKATADSNNPFAQQKPSNPAPTNAPPAQTVQQTKQPSAPPQAGVDTNNPFAQAVQPKKEDTEETETSSG
jgi:type IV secretion system protein VirD4